MDKPCTHHDALEFPDGQFVLLRHLLEGQRAVVLQLPAQAKKKRKPNIHSCRKRDVPLTGCTTRRRADLFHGRTSRQRTRSSNNLPAGS